MKPFKRENKKNKNLLKKYKIKSFSIITYKEDN